MRRLVRSWDSGRQGCLTTVVAVVLFALTVAAGVAVAVAAVASGQAGT